MIFIQRRQDDIYAGQLKSGQLSATNPYTGKQAKPGAACLDLVDPVGRGSVFEVSGDEKLCDVLSTQLGEPVEISPRPNENLEPTVTIGGGGPGDFFFWRGICVGSDTDDGLLWYGGSKELQWLPEHTCRNRTPAMEIIAELVRRALLCELDQELPTWRGWKKWPPVRDLNAAPYVAVARLTGKPPEKPYTPDSDSHAGLSVIRRGDTNEIACAGLEADDVALVPLVFENTDLAGSNPRQLMYDADSLEDLTFEEWKSLVRQHGRVIHVGRLGRSWVETATVLDGDSVVVTPQKVVLYGPSKDDGVADGDRGNDGDSDADEECQVDDEVVQEVLRELDEM